MTRSAIRWAVPADALSIAEVNVRSWKAAYPGLIPQSYLDELTPEARLGSWRSILASANPPSTGTLVLVGEGTGSTEVLEGFATIGATRDADLDREEVGEVMALYLDPPAWGKGRGAALLNAAVEELSNAGFRLATLWVLGTNERARRFYERLGWRPDGTSKLHDWTAFVATDVRYAMAIG